MKTKNVNLLKMAFYLFIGLSITLTSCSGEDGEDGKNGINGEPGPAGEDATIDVIVSDWTQIQWDTPIPSKGTMDIEVSELDIVEFTETGNIILMYFKEITEDSEQSFALPFQYKNATFSFFTQKIDGTANIVLKMEDPSEESIYDIQNDPNFTVRYVLVPINVADQTGLTKSIPPTFDDAKSLFGLN